VSVPANPSIASRALYFRYAPPAPTYPTATAPSGGAYTQPNPSSVVPPDIASASPGVALPATVLSVSGSAPDYAGLVLLVHCPDGTVVRRYAGFASGQPLLNAATWTTNGSPSAQARWQLVDTTT
jgi:hypothetical protein